MSFLPVPRPARPTPQGARPVPRQGARGAFRLALAVLMMLACAIMVQARTPDRPVILLSCPPGMPGLCQAMEQSLVRASPAPVIVRIVPRGGEAPTRPGDLGIALHLDDLRPDSMQGHLEWRRGPGGTPRTGPALRIDAMDATLSPGSYAQFTTDLIRVDAAMRQALPGRTTD